MAWHPFRNFGLKVVALILGTLLWFTVSGQQVEREIPDVPVVYRNKPPNLEITNQTNFVSVHVRGLDSLLRNALSRDFEARVDLTGIGEGTQNIPLRTDQVAAPFGVEVRKVDPPSVMAVLEPTGSAVLPVVPFIDGTPAQGFIVSATTVEPESVEVIGPERRVASATSATTDRIPIQDAKATVSANVGVGVLDGLLRLREPRTARVVVTIERAGERPFAALRVAVRGVARGLTATVTPVVVSVIMRGPETTLARLDPQTVVPYVDVSGLGRGRHEVPVLIDVAGALTVASVRPATVIVTLQ
jgi:YbbR domain-containing protein